MALVGQIVTVSDVLMDGTVNNYIMGADANVFQTNYDNHGNLNIWWIGENTNSCLIGDTHRLKFYDMDEKVCEIAKDIVTFGNSSYPYLYMNNSDVKRIELSFQDTDLIIYKEEFFFNANGTNLIHGKSNSSNTVLQLYGSSHKIEFNNNSLYVGHGSSTSYGITFSGDSRPYFGSCSSNYLIGKTDLDSAISNGTSGMATQTWVSQNYQPAGSYAAAVHNHDDRYYTEVEMNNILQSYQPTLINGGLYGINITGYAYALQPNGWFFGADVTNNIWTSDHSMIISGNYKIYARSETIHGQTVNVGTSHTAKGIYVDGAFSGKSMVEVWHDGSAWVMKLGNDTYKGQVVTGSDKRLKKNISPIQDKYIDILYDLDIVNYNRKEKDNIGLKTGVIAQQVEEIIKKYGIEPCDYEPLLIPQKETDYYLIDYPAFIPTMIKAIQDQHQEIETLKTEIAEIKELLKNK